MGSTQTMDELRSDCITIMGVELGGAYFQLHRDLVELNIVWQQYRQLFGTDDGTVELLNRTAGLFFKVVQDELWDSVLLGVCRMTDPPENRCQKNLSVRALPELISNSVLKQDVENLCRVAVAEAAFAIEQRNKRIAHRDQGHALGQAAAPLSGISRRHVEAMLSAIADVLNRLTAYFKDGTTLYDHFIDETGARILVAKLRRCEGLVKQGAG